MTLHVDPNTVLAGGKTMAQTVQDIQGQIRALDGQVQGARAFWQGQAQGAFDGVMQRYNAAITKLNQALDEFGVTTNTAAQNQITGDENASGDVQRAGSSLA